MLKNKTNIYILIPSVILVWGIIGYRIFAGVGPTKINDKKEERVEKFQAKKIERKEVYALNTDYRDPFLGTITNPDHKEKHRSKPKQSKKKVVFPKIEYTGVFSSSNKNNTVYLITIDAKQEIFKLRETHQGVKLLKGDKEKISLRYQTEKKTFYIKK